MPIKYQFQKMTYIFSIEINFYDDFDDEYYFKKMNYIFLFPEEGRKRKSPFPITDKRRYMNTIINNIVYYRLQ